MKVHRRLYISTIYVPTQQGEAWEGNALIDLPVLFVEREFLPCSHCKFPSLTRADPQKSRQRQETTLSKWEDRLSLWPFFLGDCGMFKIEVHFNIL